MANYWYHLDGSKELIPEGRDQRNHNNNYENSHLPYKSFDTSSLIDVDIARFVSSKSNLSRFNKTTYRGFEIKWDTVEVSKASGHFLLAIDTNSATRLRRLGLESLNGIREFHFQFFPGQSKKEVLHIFQFPYDYKEEFNGRYFIVWRFSTIIKKSPYSNWVDFVKMIIPYLRKMRIKKRVHNDPVLRTFQSHI